MRIIAGSQQQRTDLVDELSLSPCLEVTLHPLHKHKVPSTESLTRYCSHLLLHGHLAVGLLRRRWGRGFRRRAGCIPEHFHAVGIAGHEARELWDGNVAISVEIEPRDEPFKDIWWQNNVASLEDFDEFIDVDLVAEVLVDELEHSLDAAGICRKVILELIEGCFDLTTLGEGNSHELRGTAHEGPGREAKPIRCAAVKPLDLVIW